MSEINVLTFNPHNIPWQFNVIKSIRSNHDYSKGYAELLLSGSVGSAKSTLMSHLIVTHCMNNPGAVALIGRKSLPDLKATLFNEILNHLEGALEYNKDYFVNETRSDIEFSNGSKIISKSWSDKRYKKFRSLSLSCAAIEELTENNEEDQEFYTELKMRIGRIPNIKENFIIAACNPDSPAHWVYQYFMERPTDTKYVYYSKTAENPFLPTWYIEKLQKDLDPKVARRMLQGEWLEISSENIYYEFDQNLHYSDKEYVVNEAYPIWISWDFNIADNKPLSACAAQYIDGHFHFFDQVVVHSMRTLSSCDEWNEKGIFNYRTHFLITGDATGKARSTKSIHSDWEQIKLYLSNKNLDFRISVPLSNPPIAQRHNTVNSYLKNSLGEVRTTIYKGCSQLIKGFRLTKFKTGSRFEEDDNNDYQHITTAAGYLIMSAKRTGRVVSGNI